MPLKGNSADGFYVICISTKLRTEIKCYLMKKSFQLNIKRTKKLKRSGLPEIEIKIQNRS